MIREKIFRLHRHKSSSLSSAGSSHVSGHKFDFTFSNIQALKVPKGWDKVSLSLISYESGKTVRKSGKVPVKNGTCQWTETLSESIWISDIDNSKEVEECLLKLVVSTGSSRSGILGETTLNLAAFLSSKSPTIVSLPLKKCNHGTILKVEVRCLTPKTNLRDQRRNYMHGHKDEHAGYEDMENQSEISDSTITNNFGSSSQPLDVGSRETSFSASVSHYSFDSMDDYVGRQSFSSQSDLNGGNSFIGRQDSIESNDSASYCSYAPHASTKSVRSLQGPLNQGKNHREELRKLPHATPPSLHTNGCSSKTFKEADDATVQELEAEARMWEQNATKLSVDMESLRKELSDKNLSMTNLNTELATSNLECHKLTQEIEHLKFLLEESQNVGKNCDLQETATTNIQKELEDEIKFQNEANGNLSLQLKKTQESNIELISVLQEMEETIEKQKLEIEGLSENKSEIIYTNAKNSFGHEECSESKSLRDCDSDTSISEISVEDIHEKVLWDNNRSLELQRTLGDISVLESALQDKIIETEIEQDLKNLFLKDCVHQCNRRLAAKEEKIIYPEAALSRTLTDENLEVSEDRSIVVVSKQIGQLKEKVQELETDCDELTQENLELLFELKESRKNVSEGSNACLVSSSRDVSVSTSHQDPTYDQVSKLEDIMHQPVEKTRVADLETDEMRLMEPENNQNELVKHLSDLQEENIYLSQRVSGLEAQLRYLTDTTETSRMELQHSEYQVMVLHNQIRILDGEIESEKLATKHKLEEMEKQWSEAREECIALSKLNTRLQATTESLIEEYDSLQKFNGELKEQKLKLQNHCMFLEAKGRKFQDLRCNCAEDIGNLEVIYSLLKEEITARGEAMDSQHDAFDVQKKGDSYEYEDKHELLQLFENIMNGDSKRKSTIEELESKLRLSELERLQLAEENSIICMQLQKVPELQNEVLDLRISVKEMKAQTQLLKASFKAVSDDNEEMKSERIFMVQKISSLQKEVSEAEVCRHKKNALEEKLLRLEGDLIARDALCVQEAEMKNELNRMKVANSQFMMKVKHLENVREDLQSRLQTLEEELNQTRHDDCVCMDQRKVFYCQPQSREYLQIQENEDLVQQQVQVFNKQDSHSRRSLVPAMDYESRIQLLENELVKALQANDMYKTQLESSWAVASEKSESKAHNDTAKTEHKISILEAELQEICERYLQISLKYAEVEAQREQLVMKLKAVNS